MKCTECGGSGRNYGLFDQMVECTKCSGTGIISTPYECPDCYGERGNTSCKKCFGTGIFQHPDNDITR